MAQDHHPEIEYGAGPHAADNNGHAAVLVDITQGLGAVGLAPDDDRLVGRTGQAGYFCWAPEAFQRCNHFFHLGFSVEFYRHTLRVTIADGNAVALSTDDKGCVRELIPSQRAEQLA